jgi:hypothetical protein
MALLIALLVVAFVLIAKRNSGGTDAASTSAANSPANSFSSAIDSFMQAIYQHEGPGPRDRNNNPGNLKPPKGDPSFWNGQVGTDASGFAIFDSFATGWTALQTDIRAALRRDPSQNFYDFFNRYAPDGTGDAYAESVAEQLGADPNSPLISVLGTV